MRSVAPMRTAKVGYIVVSLILCLLGVVLIACPDLSISAIGVVCAITLIVFGCIKLVGYFSKDLFRLAFQYDLAFGILMIVLGIIVLANPESLLILLCIALGLAILADGLFKIQIAMEARQFGIREWWLIAALAILACLSGTALLLRPSVGTRLLCILLGVTLLAEGCLNFSTALTAVKIIKHQHPDIVIESEV